MYVPEYSAEKNDQILREFLNEYNFGTLINIDQNEPAVNHYPFLIEKDDSGLILWTHLARSNPQWKHLDNQSCLVVFTGPHAYVSPTYYKNKLNVPTWNYTAVHAKCFAEVVTDEDLRIELMKKLVSFHEEKNQTDWDYTLPDEFHDKLLKAIVWIKFRVVNIEGKFKLSQNRNQDDYEGVIENLSKRQSDNTKRLLKYMNLTSPYLKQ